MRILLVEDNQSVVDLLTHVLARDYQLDSCDQLDDAQHLALVGEYALIILDLGLTDGDGIELCRSLRARRNQTPILVLTGRVSEISCISALDDGADDYMLKPFLAGELRARIRALMRRQVGQHTPLIEGGDLRLDPARRTVARQTTPIKLRRKEFDLLEYLMRHSGQAISRQRLLDQIWDYNGETTNNTVDVHIKYLRDRVDRPFGTNSIRTVHGIGYCFAKENASSRAP